MHWGIIVHYKLFEGKKKRQYCFSTLKGAQYLALSTENGSYSGYKNTLIAASFALDA